MTRLTPAQQASAIAFNTRQALDLLPELGVIGAASREVYTEAVVELTAELQERLALQVDGKIGRSTREAIWEKLSALSAEALWPAPTATVPEQFEHYVNLCRRLGQELPDKHALLIGLRGVTLRDTTTHAIVSRARYDDTFVLLSRDGGVPKVKEFPGATHPYQRVMGSGVDADRDGTPDVGTIRPGRYVLERLPSAPDQPKLWLKRSDGSANIPTWRDTDHSGTIEERERLASQAATRGTQVDPLTGDFSTEVLLHPGFDARQASGKAYSSIGCQTARLSDVQCVAEFGKLDYLLLDARAVLKQLEPAPERLS